jgi:hypothetical protein
MESSQRKISKLKYSTGTSLPVNFGAVDVCISGSVTLLVLNTKRPDKNCTLFFCLILSTGTKMNIFLIFPRFAVIIMEYVGSRNLHRLLIETPDKYLGTDTVHFRNNIVQLRVCMIYTDIRFSFSECEL